MSNPTCKRLSVSVVPGPQESDEDEEGDKSPKTKNKENNLNVVNSGSEQSPVRTPRALKVATQSETKNDISTLISRKDFANVQFTGIQCSPHSLTYEQLFPQTRSASCLIVMVGTVLAMLRQMRMNQGIGAVGISSCRAYEPVLDKKFGCIRFAF